MTGQSTTPTPDRQAEIRALLAERRIRLYARIRHQAAPNPDGCRWCGYDNPHGWQYLPGKGGHQWEQPTNAQRLARMQARRNLRLSARPPVHHATTAWAASADGQEGIPYCADCQTDNCRPWLRIQYRLDCIRWGLDGLKPGKPGSWGGEVPW